MTPPETDMPETGAEDQKRAPLAIEVDVEKVDACRRHVTVTVAEQDVRRYREDAVTELQPTAEVPGFRPGRAPRKLVAARYREQVAEQVKANLLSDSLEQVSEQAEFTPISEPEFDYEAVKLPDEGPLTFEFDIEVRPEFDLPQWRGLTLRRPVCEVTDADVDRRLQEVLAEYCQLVPHDGPAEDGDQLVLRITSRHDEQVIAELDEVAAMVRPKLTFRDAVVEGFDELMRGVRAGERRTAKAQVAPEARAEGAPDEVELELEVLDVKRVELPRMDEEFLEKIGGFDSEEELRELVRERLERQATYYQNQAIRRQITEELTRDADWELPRELLRRQAKRELDRAVLELRASGFTEQAIRAHQNELRQNALATTARSLKEHFILERIAEDEGLDVSEEEIEQAVVAIAVQENLSPRRVRARLEKRGQMDALRNQIVENKVLNLIRSHAQFEDAPFELPRPEVAAVDHAVARRDSAEIPEAKHGGEAEQLRTPVDRT